VSYATATDLAPSRLAVAPATLVAVDLSAATDEDLLELVASRRDADAFEVLYGRYARAVYGVVLRVVGDRGRSEDAVQDAFASIWRAAAGYRRDRGTAAAWLFAISRNAAVDALRQRVPALLAEPPDQPDTAPGPSEATAATLEAFTVHAAVDALPMREREVIE